MFKFFDSFYVLHFTFALLNNTTHTHGTAKDTAETEGGYHEYALDGGESDVEV